MHPNRNRYKDFCELYEARKESENGFRNEGIRLD